jgi:hypothetical protein
MTWHRDHLRLRDPERARRRRVAAHNKKQAELAAALAAAEAERRAAREARRAELDARRAKAQPERQRRSRVDWGELTEDSVVATMQVGWERGATVLAMRAAGLTFRAIGERLNVSSTRASQIAAKAQRERRWGRRSPVEVWMSRSVVWDVSQRERDQLCGTLGVLAFDTRRDWLIVATPSRAAIKRRAA